jgi:plastocyanin
MESIRRQPRRIRLAACALGLALVAGTLGGCARGGPVAGRVHPPAPDAVVQAIPVRPGKPKRAVADTARVVHRDGRFDPRVLSVAAGGVVEFRNRDRVYHNAFCLNSKARFDLGAFRPGQVRRVAITNPGRYEVFCEFHPTEVLYVVVTDTPWSVTTAKDGRFLLGNLPRGEYVIEAWHPKLGTARTRITVPTKEAVRLNLKG